MRATTRRCLSVRPALVTAIVHPVWVVIRRLWKAQRLSAILPAVNHLAVLQPGSPAVVTLDVAALAAGLLPCCHGGGAGNQATAA